MFFEIKIISGLPPVIFSSEQNPVKGQRNRLMSLWNKNFCDKKIAPAFISFLKSAVLKLLIFTNGVNLLTLELWHLRKSSEMSLITTAVGGKRCINAFATRLLPGPPCLHNPMIICVARSSRLSNGSLEIRFSKIRRLSSRTSGCFSDDSNVRSNDSKCGCTIDKLSVDLSTSSIVHIAFDRNRQSYKKFTHWSQFNRQFF